MLGTWTPNRSCIAPAGRQSPNPARSRACVQLGEGFVVYGSGAARLSCRICSEEVSSGEGTAEPYRGPCLELTTLERR